jgi:heavy metal translocating P-type ATPase
MELGNCHFCHCNILLPHAIFDLMTETYTAQIPFGARRRDPFVFRTFFEMGLEESASPFFTPRARRLARHLTMKASILSLLLLALSWLLQPSPLAEILLISVYLIAGTPSLITSIEDVFFHKDVNIDVLMTIAAFSAYFLHAGFEGALLLVLFSLAGAIERLVTLQAKNALSLIHNLAPTKAYIIGTDGHLKERAVLDVKVGETVFVRSGEMVPLDGIVREGSSSMSFAHLTGESRPLYKKMGDEVPAGARALEGSLSVEVLRTSADSTLARIIRLITLAQEARPNLERWFDRFGRRYALSIIGISFACALAFHFQLGLPLLGTEGAIYRALAFLITASPCALILAVPIAYLSALGAAARKGIVLKGGVVLDALTGCQIVAFDKTGTLTLGALSYDMLERQEEDAHLSDGVLLQVAASLEKNAFHPISEAICEAAKRLPFLPIENIQVIPGKGVSGVVTIDGRKRHASIGAVADVALSEHFRDRVAARQKEGKIVALLSIDDKNFILSFQDKPRPDVGHMIQRLLASGLRVIMLTGDHLENAARIAAQLGISEYYADLKPEDKLEKISTLSAKHGLAMCGDGINDAPALARATVGIAMGKVSSATARDAADCILLHDTIETLDWLFAKAHLTKKVVRQNVCIALSAICFASLPALYGVVPLWLAVVLHEGGTVLVGLNAIRLLRD